MRDSYIELTTPNFHIARKKAMQEKYPEIKNLMGQNRWSALWIVVMVLSQLSLSYFFQSQNYLILVLGAYFIGAFMSHGLFVQIHECCHNMVFRRSTWSRVMGIICDTSLFLPGAMAFRKYHMVHHRHMGEYIYDADIASAAEARFIGNSSFKKSLWIIFFGLSQAMRPMRFDNIKLVDKWLILNIIYVVNANILIFTFLGPKALLYMALSTLFGLGPHPVGGRWIQEHYVTKDEQETYSYYGPLNKFAFNVGFHNEHHDFMNIPWNNLPKLKALAPEFYDGLQSYNSWTLVLWNFITNKDCSVFDRVLHPVKKSKVEV